MLGRLKSNVTPGQAQAEFESLVKHLSETGSAQDHQFHPIHHTIVSYGLHDEVVRGVRLALRMLLGAVLFVLLIACVNVANLLLARAEARQREIGIRGAIGAGLTRLAVQFVTEGIVLSILGAMVGLFLAYGGLQFLKVSSEGSIPRISEIALDVRVLLFTVAVCIATGVVFGLTPLAHVAKQILYEVLKSTGGSTTGAARTQPTPAPRGRTP